jgi:hypothetical protein
MTKRYFTTSLIVNFTCLAPTATRGSVPIKSPGWGMAWPDLEMRAFTVTWD